MSDAGYAMLFHNWSEIFRTLIVGVLAYVALLVMLRVSGKRTLSKMNAYDLIVTVALGSTLATILLSEDVALAEGIVAFAVLIGLQFAIAWLSVRSQTVLQLVKSTPQLLFYRGSYLERDMQRERVSREEVLAAIRAQGLADLEAVEAVVLETDGSFTVIERSQPIQRPSLHGVRGEQVRQQPQRRR
jgi:uncharacterized membrane protein YcaP (DUF421 family)